MTTAENDTIVEAAPAPADAGAKPTDETPVSAAAADASAAEPTATAAEKENDENAKQPAAVAVAENDATAKPAPKKRGRKRKVVEEPPVNPATEATTPAATAASTPAAAAPPAAHENDEETESEAETQTAKRAKTTATKGKRGRPAGRKKKEVVEESSDDDDDALLQKTEKLVEELPNEIKSKFGSIVWAKMGGYPYWPALITDPRRLADPGLIRMATNEITSRYLVRFYKTNNFSAMLFKKVEEWTDTKHPYREGYPTKDAKAPKRRADLMAAIELADKDIHQPIEERMDGLLKVVKRGEEPKEAPPVVQKRKPGRPLGSKNKPKVPPPPGAEPAEPPKKPGRRGRKKKEETAAVAEQSGAKAQETETTEAPAEEEEEPEAAAPALSKEEIKDKVANKKAPSKKKTTTAPDEKSNGAAAAKKPAKASAAALKSQGVSKSDIDAKRKKEIELVVPRKSVKSSDLREATEEATRKQSTGKNKEKRKDKIEYKVGNMSQFAKKMTRLNANESSKNNDELIEMLTQLFEETVVYRSDVEHSGLAAIIAILRKVTNPTVAQTASAVRRHLMNVLKGDDEVKVEQKKHKAESSLEGDSKPSKKPKIEQTPTNQAEPTPAPASPVSAATTPEESEKKSVVPAEPEKKVPAPVTTPESKPSDDTKVKETQVPAESSTDELMKPSDAPEKANAPVVSSSGAESPLKEEAALPVETKPIDSTPRPDPSTDKVRMNCIDMLGKALEPNGSKNVEIATQIEEQLFDRFKESNAEYISFARKITFTLKRNARIRDRLFNGSLHALELAYASDALLKEM